MNRISGIMTQTTTGSYQLFPTSSVENFKLKLKKDKIWRIGIDQSTSCTGLCIQSSDNEFQVLLDVHRDKNLLMAAYYKDLFKIIYDLVKDQNIQLMILEKPAPKAGYTPRVLQELKGHVEEWKYQISELENALMDSVFPQTWKSYIVDKSKGSGRGKYKRCIAEDITDRFPTLRPYFLNYPWEDYDSFDATGILNGFLEYAFSGDLEKIHGVKEKRHTSLVCYRWVDKNDPYKVFDGLDDVIKERYTSSGLVFNERYSLHDNIRMASSNYPFCYTILPKSVLEPFIWKYGVDIDDKDKIMVAFIMNKSKLQSAISGYMERTIEWHEEVFDQ